MKATTIVSTFLCLCLLCAAPAFSADAQVRAQVLEKTIQAGQVVLVLRWLGKAPKGSGGIQDTVGVAFKAGAKGCPDLTNPANRKKLAALGAEPGDILLLKLGSGPKGLTALEARFAASDLAVSFPGREKITPGLVAELLTPGSQLPVIATLDTRATGKKLKKQIEGLLKTLPPGSFKPSGSFDKLPVLTGSAGLAGLMALAKSPLVKAIQSDDKAVPAKGGDMSMPSGEVLK